MLFAGLTGLRICKGYFNVSRNRMKQPKIYLVDGSAYFYRAYHAVRPLSNSSGLPTHAIYGFATILRRIIKEKNPEWIAVAWDTKGPVFRHRLFPEYKANRPPMPDDLAVQIPYIRKLVDAWNITSMEDDDQEADDMIASSACRLTKNGCRVVIVSGDKDLLQLVSETVVLWDPMSDKLMDEQAVKEKYGISPAQLLDYMSLTGDSADNIPGVTGIGPKTAQKLILAHGSLDGLYENIETMKRSKMKERLIEHRDDAFLARELIRLNRAVEVPANPQAYFLGPADNDSLRSLLIELEFTSMLAAQTTAKRINTDNFHLIGSAEELTELMSRLSGIKLLAIDTETSSVNALAAELVGISLCVDTEQAWYIPCGHRDKEGHLLAGQLQAERVISLLQPLLENAEIAKVGHNIKYDWTVLSNPDNGGLKLRGLLYDTMIGAWLIDPGHRSYKLDDLCRKINVEMTSFKEVTNGAKGDGAFVQVELEAAKNYSCEDVHGTMLLLEHQRHKLEKLGLWELFSGLEASLIPVLSDMERVGILVDRDALTEMSKEFAGRLLSLKKEIYRIAGKEFNINSPGQLADILFNELGLPRGRKTKTGYSTDMKVLEKLSNQHELPASIIGFRNLAKLKSTYIDKLAGLAELGDGRIHSSFNQCGTATGRLSSSDPNLQNIPIRTSDGRRIRSVFVAKPGCMFIAADYSQIDLRVLAHYCEDEVLTRAFKKGEDIHSKTAAEIFHVSLQLVTKEMRRVAKTINFGIVYGMSSFGLAGQLQISRREAQGFIDRYFEVYSGVKSFMESVVQQAEQDGFVKTLLGRHRYLPEINSRNRSKRDFSRRVAINTPVQGTAADIIKMSMCEVARGLNSGEIKGAMVLQIHDELVLETPEGETERTGEFLGRVMENVMSLSVPLVVNLSVGRNLDM